jgi:aspartate racemase
MKVIGVLGGLGPQATIYFEVRLHRAAQRRIRQRGNEGYPTMVSYFFRQPPVIMSADGSLPQGRPPVNPALLDAARWIGTVADFLVITSNGVHHWQAEIEQAAGRPVVSMIDAALSNVLRRGCRRVGLVDFRPAAWGVYSPGLDRLGVAWEALPDEQMQSMTGVMLAVDEGRAGAAEERLLQEAIALLRHRGADAIILACTEFPLALTGELAADIINPTDLLATAALDAALAE